jgi:hypothetical protein
LPASGLQVTVVTRITEKTSLWTAYCLSEVFKHLHSLGVMQKTTNLHLWSDGATAYKSTCMLTFCCLHWPAKYGVSIHSKYGLEHHLKGAIDRFFGLLDLRLKHAETSRLICSVADVLEVFRAGASPSREEVFLEVEPTITRTKYIKDHRMLNIKTLPGPIRSSHYFTWRIADSRRESLLGADLMTVTGIVARSHQVQGLRADCFSTTMKCQLACDADTKKIVDEEDPLEVEAEPEKVCEVMGEGNGLFLEWKCSFRKTAPEKPSKVHTMGRLLTKQVVFGDCLKKLSMSSRVLAWVPNHAAAVARRTRAALECKAFAEEREAARAST